LAFADVPFLESRLKVEDEVQLPPRFLVGKGRRKFPLQEIAS
jgi:hypothetical protein